MFKYIKAWNVIEYSPDARVEVRVLKARTHNCGPGKYVTKENLFV